MLKDLSVASAFAAGRGLEKEKTIMETMVPAVFRARFVAAVLLTAASSMAQVIAPDPGCTVSDAWTEQKNPWTDTVGVTNTTYPDANVTYWIRWLSEGPPGAQSPATIHGQFPASRYMSFSLYDSSDDELDSIHDTNIAPDPGQNNPFQTAGPQGTYTITIVYGTAPAMPAANTLYTGDQTVVKVYYRVYYPDSSGNLTGGTSDPVLPTISVFGGAMPTCAPRPIVSPITNTVWGRLDQTDFTGVKPAQGPTGVFSSPIWKITSGTGNNANADNTYMGTYLSRDFLTATTPLLVVKFKAPTFPNTQNGVPPYTSGEQVRYWSLCTDEPLASAVARCVPDGQAATLNGYATFVISDPSNQPSASVLSQWGATWIAWGALEYSTDFLYNENYQPFTSADGAFYYNVLLYRQTLASSSFQQSMANISKLPTILQKAAMGAYWPVSGYCSIAQFQSAGAGCITQ